MKVFLSHQRKDSLRAADIAVRLKQNGLDVYLDLADETAQLGVDDLTTHIQRQMTSCTQLMAVISSNARESWWVPWEIGVATEKSYPIASLLWIQRRSQTTYENGHILLVFFRLIRTAPKRNVFTDNTLLRRQSQRELEAYPIFTEL